MKRVFKLLPLQRSLSSAVYALALSVLLLFAQQVALHHQVGHVLDGTTLQQAASPSTLAQAAQADAPALSSPALQHNTLCDFHEAFASILGVVGTATPFSAWAQPAAEQHRAYVASLAPTEIVVPASRGPPAVLLSSFPTFL